MRQAHGVVRHPGWGAVRKSNPNLKPITDEVRNRLFPAKSRTPPKTTHRASFAAGRASSKIEGYAAICWYFIDDGFGNWVYWEEYC